MEYVDNFFFQGTVYMTERRTGITQIYPQPASQTSYLYNVLWCKYCYQGQSVNQPAFHHSILAVVVTLVPHDGKFLTALKSDENLGQQVTSQLLVGWGSRGAGVVQEFKIYFTGLQFFAYSKKKTVLVKYTCVPSGNVVLCVFLLMILD